jgi:hypothetical protein
MILVNKAFVCEVNNLANDCSCNFKTRGLSSGFFYSHSKKK